MLAGLAAISAQAAANPVPEGRNSSIARATARIDQPVLLRDGRAERPGQAIRRSARERTCPREEAPGGAPCRMIVTDLE